MKSVKFKASFDKKTMIISSLVGALFIGQTVFFLVFSNLNSTLTAVIAISLWLIFVLCYGFHPAGYECTEAAIIIKTPFRSIVYPKAEMDKIRRAGDEEMVSSIRTFGVGGLFGYYGKFYNRHLGHMTWYASQGKNWVILLTKNGKNIVLTPDNPQQFIETLQGSLS
ncbi:MAG: hypothetical protein IPP77_08985 [Bacteroidetes bacterium]|nr:hypothetical protein [Bacteroidota bacterium]